MTGGGAGLWGRHRWRGGQWGRDRWPSAGGGAAGRHTGRSVVTPLQGAAGGGAGGCHIGREQKRSSLQPMPQTVKYFGDETHDDDDTNTTSILYIRHMIYTTAYTPLLEAYI